jgi:hypothetical protein
LFFIIVIIKQLELHAGRLLQLVDVPEHEETVETGRRECLHLTRLQQATTINNNKIIIIIITIIIVYLSFVNVDVRDAILMLGIDLEASTFILTDINFAVGVCVESTLSVSNKNIHKNPKKKKKREKYIYIYIYMDKSKQREQTFETWRMR